MKKTWAVAAKEFRQARRDPLTLTMLLGLPAMMLLLFGFALNFDVRHVPLAVQDADRSRASRELVAAFTNSTYFDLVADLPASADLTVATQRKLAKAILVIPERFGRELGAGRTAPLQIIVDGADANTATTVLGYAETIATAYGASLQRRAAPIEVRPRVWYNPELSSTYFLVPGLIGFILMLTAVLSTALSIVREKERGTMEQLEVTPLGKGELILGKTIPYLLISAAATAVILVAARLLFGLTVRGSYLALSAATLLYLLGALGLGLLISSAFRSQALAFQTGAVASMLPAIFLSGFIFPIRSMPLPLRVISYAVPARHYLVVLRGLILKGAPLGLFGPQLGMLAAYAAIVLTIAWIRLTREEHRP